MDRYRLVRDAFMENIIIYQEETMLCTVDTYKEMLKWDERAHRTLNQIEYIREIQKGRVKKSMASGSSLMTTWLEYKWPQNIGFNMLLR
jgi:hypothetical protein